MSATSPSDSRHASQVRLRAVVFLVLASVAGGGAIMMVKVYLDKLRNSARAPEVPTVPVVVAAMDIPIAMRLEEKHLKVIQWPKEHVPEETFGDPKELLDRTVQTDVFAGEPLLQERLASEDEGRGLAALLAPGIRAMAIKVDGAIGVAGFVRPGDFVDVIATMKPDEDVKKKLQIEASRVSKIILQNIMVLAVGEHLTTEGTRPVQVKVVTVAVTPEESERLALATQWGKITLTMRPRVDQSQEATAGVSPVKLLSPDDEALIQAKAEEPRQVLRTSSRRRRRARDTREAEKPEAAPVVEILRGSKVEKRELRLSETP